jgi:Kef-type K+ transport system membrane component KefB
MTDLMLNWSEWIKPSAGLPTVQWSLLLALAAAAGYLLQRHLGLPKVLGYSVVGALAGFSGYTTATWPLDGIALFMVELGLSIVLFEAGGRLTLRWFRHNPMLLLQSVAESSATFLAAYWTLMWFEVTPALRAPLSLLVVATSPAVLMRVAVDVHASGPVTARAIMLASLNTLYVLALGGVMARFIGRPSASIMDGVYPVILLLFTSVLFGAILAMALRKALTLMSPTSENTAVLLLALIAAGTTLAANFGGSAPLAALLAGILLKTLHQRPWSWPRQLGTAASILTILMFVLVSMAAAQTEWSPAAWRLIVTLALVRTVAKMVAISLGGVGSGASPRQALETAMALSPMSVVALLLVSQFAQFAPALGVQMAAVALPLILLMEVLGAIMSTIALQRAGEAARPVAVRGTKPSRGDSGAA